MTLDRIDFLRRTLRVDRQLVGSHQGRPVFGPPMTAANVRTIPLPQVVVEALAEHIRVRCTGQEGLLFVGTNGVALRRAWWARDVWQPAVRPVEAAPAGTGMHSVLYQPSM